MMKSIVTHFLKYPIWANVLMVAILLFGYNSATNLRTSFFPEMEPGRISISVVYPGTSAQEIERSIVSKIEDNLVGIEGIDRTSSVSRENSASINVYTEDKADVDEVLEDVKNAVDQVTPWPSGAETPRVTKDKFSMPGLIIALSGDMDLWSLKKQADDLEDKLMDDPGLSRVSVSGVPNREISVEVDEATLDRYQLTFEQISTAIQLGNLDVSGGRIQTDTEELMIRAYNKEATVDHIRDIMLKARPDGTVLRVGDVARVNERFEETSTINTFNGKKAVFVQINQTETQDLLDVVSASKKISKEWHQNNPQVHMDIVFDSTINLKDRIKLLQENGSIGLILVLLTLTFFLNLRTAFWVALGIPISFAGMFVIADAGGITINVLSLFGMIVVVGILVDDAIVVAEQTFQGIEKGMSPLKASRWGVLKVMAPVFTAVVTTMLAFLPFFFLEGRIGKMIWQLALVVVGALFFSLIESFFILPAHLAHSKGVKNENPGKLRKKIDRFYEWLSRDVYGKFLDWTLRNPLITLATAIAALMLTIGLFKGGFVKFNPFPALDRDDITLNLTLTSGTQENVTDSLLRELELASLKINEEFVSAYGKSYFSSTRVSVGGNALGDVGSHAGAMTIELIPGEQREITAKQIMGIMREKLPKFHETRKFSFSEGHWGKPVTVEITGKDITSVRKARDLVIEELEEYAALKDIVDEDQEGGKEIMLDLKPRAYALGLTESMIASQIRQGFYGTEVQRIQRGEDEIRIWVRYDEEKRTNLRQLETMKIRTNTGMLLPLSELADYNIERGLSVIKHRDGNLAIQVSADLSGDDVSSSEAQAQIDSMTFPKVLAEVPGVDLNFQGQARSNQNFNESLKRSFTPALIGILVILILVFRSWTQAFVIFMMIPFGLIGAVWGHMFHDLMITRMSTFGLIALTGIVINDSIVFVDQINYNIRSGMKIFDAIHEGGVNRLRPILMTTITTVAGLAPLIMETSFQAQFLIPMAVSVAWGLLMGSVFILLLTPTLFMLLNRIRYYFRVLTNMLREVYLGEEPVEVTYENVEPAWQEAQNLEEAHEL